MRLSQSTSPSLPGPAKGKHPHNCAIFQKLSGTHPIKFTSSETPELTAYGVVRSRQNAPVYRRLHLPDSRLLRAGFAVGEAASSLCTFLSISACCSAIAFLPLFVLATALLRSSCEASQPCCLSMSLGTPCGGGACETEAMEELTFSRKRSSAAGSCLVLELAAMQVQLWLALARLLLVSG